MSVCKSIKQVREERDPKWSWTEPAVWTPQMLKTLERGVKGGKWFSLIDKVYSERNLRAAFQKVKANKGAAGIDNETVRHFERKLDKEIAALKDRLEKRTYTPSAVKRVYIPKPGSKEKRPLGIPTVRDRIVQAAVRQAIEPIFEREFKECSYGFRPGRGGKDALREVVKGLKEGYRYVVDADIEKFFDTIDQNTLMELVERRISDGGIISLIRAFLEQGVLENGEIRASQRGTPQGGVISPLLANIYLHEVDEAFNSQDVRIVRYADDLVILCRSEEEAQNALKALKEITEQLSLRLHTEKTKTVNMNVPGVRFTFLGYDFVTSKRKSKILKYPSKKSRKNLRNKLRELTRRTDGNSFATIILRVNLCLKGWFLYFMHSSKGAFVAEDKWLRVRLRNILDRRNHRKSRGRGLSHFRHPVEFFRQSNLLIMEEQRALLLQPDCR